MTCLWTNTNRLANIKSTSGCKKTWDGTCGTQWPAKSRFWACQRTKWSVLCKLLFIDAETPIAALQVLCDTSLQGCFVAHLKWRTTICDYGHEWIDHNSWTAVRLHEMLQEDLFSVNLFLFHVVSVTLGLLSDDWFALWGWELLSEQFIIRSRWTEDTGNLLLTACISLCGLISLLVIGLIWYSRCKIIPDSVAGRKISSALNPDHQDQYSLMYIISLCVHARTHRHTVGVLYLSGTYTWFRS